MGSSTGALTRVFLVCVGFDVWALVLRWYVMDILRFHAEGPWFRSQIRTPVPCSRSEPARRPCATRLGVQD